MRFIHDIDTPPTLRAVEVTTGFFSLVSGSGATGVLGGLTVESCFFSVFSGIDGGGVWEEVNLLPHCSQKLLEAGFFVPHFPHVLTSGIPELLGW